MSDTAIADPENRSAGRFGLGTAACDRLAAVGTAVCGRVGADVPSAAKRGGQARRLNGMMLALLAILLLGLLWWFDPAEMRMPLCTFHALTGLDCPGCGATRATHELLHGRLLAAWRYNALWVLSLPVAAYVAISELRVLAGHRPLPGDLARRTWFWLSVAAVAILFFVVRNLS